MKKINFMAFFTSSKESPFERSLMMATKIVVPLYFAVILAMHGIQGYKWYQFSQQKKKLSSQSSSFETITKDHSYIQKEKLTMQEKINFLHEQKKEALERYEQLKAIFYNPQELLTHVTIKNNQFSCASSQKTTHKAHAFLKELKAQPVVRKARITHLKKNNGNYTVDIKGAFTIDY